MQGGELFVGYPVGPLLECFDCRLEVRSQLEVELASMLKNDFEAVVMILKRSKGKSCVLPGLLNLYNVD